MSKKVVVTGIGLLTPFGTGVSNTWSNILNSKSCITSISSFNTDQLSSKIAGIIDNKEWFVPEDYISARDIKKMDKFIQYGMMAAIQAIQDSGINTEDEIIQNSTGVITGAGIGGLESIENNVLTMHVEKRKVSPYFIPSTLINLLSGHISIQYKLYGPNHAVSTACATGAHAIGDAMKMIQRGDANVMVAGASEGAVTPLGVAGFDSIKALSAKFNDSPEEASRPWDIDRNGFVISEGAGIVVLEEYEHAKKRNAKIYAELLGYGLSGDAHHVTSPHPDGISNIKAMKIALNDAKLSNNQIDYINAHGTSTILGDLSELNAVQKLFYDANPKIMMSSNKSSIGHLLGGAGSVEFILTILAIQDQIAPPTINLHNPIPEAKIDLVPLTPKKAKINYAMTNSFGFGGTNATLVIGKI